MTKWSIDLARKQVHNFDNLNSDEQEYLVDYLNQTFPPDTYELHRNCRKQALENLKTAQTTLEGAQQHFPHCIDSSELEINYDSLLECGIVLTAGGDGERLRNSLIAQGVAEESLRDFTKATCPLPDFYRTCGTLQTTLAVISDLCARINHQIPVIITTGPAGSVTSRVIPKIIGDNNNFGLKHIQIISQDERLHLTQDNKIAWAMQGDKPLPITHPDETGGPLMKLRARLPGKKESALDWLSERNCKKTIVLQGTALYDPKLILHMASAGIHHNAVGAGILRKSFCESDPFGTFVVVEKNDRSRLIIIEQEIRNAATFSLKDPSGSWFLPFNTGLYVFSLDLLAQHSLPDYATPPKQVLPELERSPKIGYAATDLLPFAADPAVLTISSDSFGVLKTADDLQKLSDLGKKFELHKICEKVENPA
ncbi:MAG: hypothetical protein GF401_08220 [Chitinivibrionales bacterium]|nr:hypothetical protein [Chitinivibrionales bacterium]